MIDYSEFGREELEAYAARLEEENQILKDAIEEVSEYMASSSDDWGELSESLRAVDAEVSEIELYNPEFDDVLDDIEDLVDHRR